MGQMALPKKKFVIKLLPVLVSQRGYFHFIESAITKV